MGQGDLFGEAEGDGDNVGLASVSPLPTVTDFSRGERLGWEKELLGIYLTEHPVKPFEPELRRKHATVRSDRLGETQPSQQIKVGGMVTEVKTRYTKTGLTMLNVVLEDTMGPISVTLFPRTAGEYGKFVIQNAVVVISVKAQHRERILKGGDAEGGDGASEGGNVQVEIIADKVERIVENAMAADARPRTVHVRIDAGAKGLLRIVKEQLAAHPGGSPVFLHAETPTGEHVIRTETLMDPDEALLEQVRRMLGGGPRRAWVE